jgi:hypothetical protein
VVVNRDTSVSIAPPPYKCVVDLGDADHVG